MGRAHAETVGRGSEQAVIETVIRRAAGGHAAGLLLRGEAGIGKTSLLRWGRTAARELGFSTIEAVGLEGTLPAPYSGLEQLLACIGPELDSIDVDIRALRAAVDGAGTVSAVQAAAAFLQLVTTLAERAPVLVVVDDAHWIDDSTATAVGTLARRAEADRVAVLAASRHDLLWWPATGMASLEVTGLDEPTSIALLQARAGLDEQLARDCWRATAGNPLALLELGPSWSTGFDAARARIPERLGRAFDQRLDAVGEPVERALLALALERAGDGRVINAVATPEAIDVGIEHSLLDRHDGTVQFAHPLLRARVIKRAGAAALGAAHLRLADAATAVGDREMAVWHLAEAASGSDDALASELFDVGQSCRRRGATREWQAASERAAALTTDRGVSASRLVDAMGAAWHMSDHDRVERLYREVRRRSEEPEVRGKAAIVYGQELMWRDGALTGYRFLIDEATAIGDAEPSDAAVCMSYASAAAALALRADLTLTAAQRAVTLAESGDDLAARMVAQCALGTARQLAGDQAAADALLAPVEQLSVAAAEAGMAEADHLVNSVARAHGYAERWERAIDMTSSALNRGRKAGIPDLVASASTTLAELAMRTGRWTEAYGLLRTTIDDPDWGIPGQRAWVQGALARICAGLGRDEECRSAAATALEIALPIGFTVAEAWAASALGLLELGAGRLEAALVHLDRVDRIFAKSHVVEPGALWWLGDHLDALVAVGDRARAKERLADAEAIAERTGRRYALAVTCRARAQLVDQALAEPTFADAVEHATALGSPFELARTLLARSSSRVRGGAAGANDDAARALASFEVLGASSWTAQVTDSATAPSALTLDALTKAELRVAMAVARGLTNRQAAIELYLSTKTVDFYLQNIYRKLDVRSRTEMARVVLGASG